MKVSSVSYSLSIKHDSLELWSTHLCEEIDSLISDGSDLIIYPEFFLMALSDHLKDLGEISRYTSETLLPKIADTIGNRNIMICLGSGPRIVEAGLRNSSPIWLKGVWHFQDKLHLTPWESDFLPGHELNHFLFKDFKISVLICFDVEQPSLALHLKESGTDILLVPAATTDRYGNNRVNRCASARSVELGAIVFTVPLIGQTACELVDHNEGRQGVFVPSQLGVPLPEEAYSAYTDKDHVVSHYQLDEELLKKLKINDQETKPYFKKEQLTIKSLTHV